MTWPAALPGAVVRVLRTAAGRRALQVALLVGGLFVLGFLTGEQAHAAERTQPVSSEVGPTGPAGPVDGIRSLTGSAIDTVGRLTGIPAVPAERPHSDTPARPTAPATAPAASGANSGAGPRPAADLPAQSHRDTPTSPTHRDTPTSPAHRDTAPPTDQGTAPSTTHRVTTSPTHPVTPSTAQPVTAIPTRPVTAPSRRPLTDSLAGLCAGDQVLGPAVGQLVRSVGDRVLQPVGGLVETVTAGLGSATAQIPPLSSLPNLPGLPGSPAVPVLPGLPGVPGHTLPVPVTQAPQPAPGGHAAEAAVDDRRSGSGASGTAYGPRSASHLTKADGTGADLAPGQRQGQRFAGAGHAPVHQAPDNDPTDELAGHAATDNGTPRHGDAHAVTLNHRAPVLLLPGAAARTDAADTRDRYRDIPVFPA